ncbi:MAG: hypothetical protein IPK87_07890 [Planctomycetes bacterium]|nr:hypothetical protein [Planctomycetota bacterium]
MAGGYVNFVARGASTDQILDFLRSSGRTAYVAEAAADVIVFDKQCEEMDEREICDLAVELSAVGGCPVLGVCVFSDDILRYWLAANGAIQDQYNSSPGYFDSNATTVAPPTPANVDVLCKAFGSSLTSEVASVLAKTIEAEDCYAFESERHASLAALLTISATVVWNTYSNIAERDFTDRQEPPRLKHVP